MSMFSCKLPRLLAVLGAVTAGFILPAAIRAQTPGIEGIWQISHPKTLFVPEDGKPIPFNADGKKQYDANKAAAAKGDVSFDDTMTTCATPGQPRLMLTNEPFVLFVTPRMVTIVYQWNRVFRQILLGKPMVSPAVGNAWWQFGTRQGRSIAKWQGNALMVHTDTFLDGRLIDALIPSTDGLSFDERLSLSNPSTLEDHITITDPDIFTRSWDTVVTYKRLPDSRFPFPEDVCFERLKGNQPAIQR